MMKMSGRLGLRQAALICLLALPTGCQLLHSKSKSVETDSASGTASINSAAAQSTNNTAALDHAGYALLFDLLGDEKDVVKLRFIKHPRTAVVELLKEISIVSKRAHQQLEAFGKADHSLNLKVTGLPIGETAARKAIGKTKENALLFSKGKDLEIQLLLTQQEAMNYGAHLAKTIAASESQPLRQQFLRRLETELTQLEQKLVGMLSQNYIFPDEK
jgi:hypothetical protein